MSVVIKVQNVSKQYRLGLVGTGTMRDDLEGWWYRMRGKEDPTLKLGETNDRTSSSDSNYVWALQDVNFEVKQGEVLGIIGKNGAGKSTLLKLLSRVTAPTIGNIKVKGRIASLLEVGTGFHPELTGKENIFLNGAIMGMKKNEISRKLEEIVDFAGVERYLETPVKRYSSGMYVRLAFAVAAHLEPEILIVDEVLAVGDADFQKKALGKMKEVSSGGGRSVLFVSHNMASVKSLCPKSLLLENGKLKYLGTTDEVILQYQGKTANQESLHRIATNCFHSEDFEVSTIQVSPSENKSGNVISMNDKVYISVDYKSRSLKDVRYDVTLGFRNGSGELFMACTTLEEEHSPLTSTGNRVTLEIPDNFLNEENFSVDFLLMKNRKELLLSEANLLQFSVITGHRKLGGWIGKIPVPVKPKFLWTNHLT